MYIDFHSHILPAIDDGSRNIETSIRMLVEERKQGVEAIVATPHFYADTDRIEPFIEKRAEAFRRLNSALSSIKANTSILPKLFLGAEVTYFPGICQSQGIEKLVFQGAAKERLLLLEMPFRAWRSKEVDEVANLIFDRKFDIIIAHPDRFTGAENRKQFRRLLELPVILQVNCDSIIDDQVRTDSRGGLLASRKRDSSIFSSGRPVVLGCDAHGLHKRPPNMAAAREKLPAEILQEIDRFGQELLGIK